LSRCMLICQPGQSLNARGWMWRNTDLRTWRLGTRVLPELSKQTTWLHRCILECCELGRSLQTI